jgi:hypothetical protein
MSAHFSNTEFYQELESSLPVSTQAQRTKWATTIIEEDLDIRDLSRLLRCERKIASRFLWLLSDVAILHPPTLMKVLPFLFELSDQLDPVYKLSFASWWHYVGVPPENEGRAIDLLFQWLLSSETNVTTKSRSLWVLAKLTKKYPELKNELKLCLNEQMDKYSKDFEKRAAKILKEME